MRFQIDVKIEAGTRTETKVFAEPRSANQKEIKFKSGLVLTNYEIAKLVEDFLIDKLGKLPLDK